MYRILLVDDEINVLSALKRSLQRIEFEELDSERPEIETFVSARQALARLRHVTVDLIISDFRMPEMSGIEFLTEAVQAQPDVARLVLSGNADLDAIVEAINPCRSRRSHLMSHRRCSLRLLTREKQRPVQSRLGDRGGLRECEKWLSPSSQSSSHR